MYSMSLYMSFTVTLDNKIPPKPGIIGLGNLLSTVRFLNTVSLSVLLPGDWEARGQLVEDGLQGEQKDVIRAQTTWNLSWNWWKAFEYLQWLWLFCFFLYHYPSSLGENTYCNPLGFFSFVSHVSPFSQRSSSHCSFKNLSSRCIDLHISYFFLLRTYIK